MAIHGSIDASELGKLGRDARILGEELGRDLLGAVARASAATWSTMRLGMPIFTGEGVNSIQIQGARAVPSPRGTVYTDSVFSNTPQVLIADEGRAPGAQAPPRGPIRRWVELKAARGQLDLSWTGKQGEQAIDSATIVIVEAIRRRGLPARRISERAVGVGQAALESEVETLVDAFRRRLE